MGMAWEAIFHTFHPNPNAVISQPYWLHHSEKAYSLGWEVIVPWYPSKLYWFFFIFFCNKKKEKHWASTSLSLSLVFLQLNSGKQTTQMHINKRQGAFNELYKLSSPLLLPITLRTGTGVALTSWLCKAVDHQVGLHWIWAKLLKMLWTSLPWGYCGATDLPSGVAGAGGTRVYGRTNICLGEAQSFFSAVLCYSFIK